MKNLIYAIAVAILVFGHINTTTAQSAKQQWKLSVDTAQTLAKELTPLTTIEDSLTGLLKQSKVSISEVNRAYPKHLPQCGAAPGKMAGAGKKLPYQVCQNGFMRKQITDTKGRIKMLEDLVAKIPASKPNPIVDDSAKATTKGTTSKGNTKTTAKGAGTKTAASNSNTTAAATDTAAATPARPQAEADFIKRNYGKYAYGTAIDITLAKDDSIGVQTFQNVKSRSGKVEDQWGVTIKHADGTVTEYLVSGENPNDALLAQLSTAKAEGGDGTAKLSVKHGDCNKKGQISDLQ